jgi:hypothetical protein
MEQKELIRNGEGEKKDTFAILLVMYLNDSDKLIEESRTFKSIVIDWYRVRGENSEKVNLVAVSDPLYHKAIKELFEGLHAIEISLRPVFKSVPFELSLHDKQGTLVQRYDFLPGEEKIDGSFAKLLKKVK